MATRFYYRANQLPPVQPAFGSGYADTSVAVRRCLTLAQESATESDVGNLADVANDNDLIVQLISPPLAGDVTITGTYSLVSRGKKGASTDVVNKRWRRVAVVSMDGGTVRNEILAPSATASTTSLSATTLQGQQHANGGAVGTVNALNGDRIVIELGYGQATAGTTSQWEMILGGTGTDHANANGDTTGTVPWSEFSQNLVFQNEPSPPAAHRPRLYSVLAPWRREQALLTQPDTPPAQDHLPALTRVEHRIQVPALLVRGRATNVVPAPAAPPPPPTLISSAYRHVRLDLLTRARERPAPPAAAAPSPTPTHRRADKYPLPAVRRRAASVFTVEAPASPPPTLILSGYRRDRLGPLLTSRRGTFGAAFTVQTPPPPDLVPHVTRSMPRPAPTRRGIRPHLVLLRDVPPLVPQITRATALYLTRRTRRAQQNLTLQSEHIVAVLPGRGAATLNGELSTATIRGSGGVSLNGDLSNAALVSRSTVSQPSRSGVSLR